MIIADKICTVEQCKNKHNSRGYCKSHYNQWYKGMDLHIPKQIEYHGLSHTPEYDIWTKMKARCLNKHDKDYPEWGGRGIKVCNAWRESFAAFHKDMGFRPSKKHSLDRIDNNGNYEPSNCRWATPNEQASNKRLYKRNKTGYSGIYKIRNKYRVQLRKNGVYTHLGYYKSLEAAIDARNSVKLA